MSVRVQLDHDHGHIYTNLDYVTGRAILTLPTDATISAITIKLEAESKTRLAGPKSPHDQERKRTELELHKLLYKVQTVFPAPELRDGTSTKNSQFTLLRGQYEYPFKLKMPFNTDCINNTSLMKDLKVGQLTLPFGEEPEHSKNPLPPTLGGFPGEADIKYYVKATVVRPKFYQENLRSQVDIKFLPIEPPRPPDKQQETFARRKHQFQHFSAAPKRSGLLRKMSAPPPEEEPLSFQVDARLPNPAIITCREPLPLRILVEKLNQSTASVYLSMIQIELIGHTSIRAHDLNRQESGTWLIVSQANMNIPLEHPSSTSNIWTVPPRLWEQIPLPNTVAPSFTTCNLSRKYELEVRVGLAHGMADGVRPELIVSPLRLSVEVYSGIAPPPKLLQAMASQRKPNTAKQPEKRKRPSVSKSSATPISPSRTSSFQTGDNFVTPPQSRNDSYVSSVPPNNDSSNVPQSGTTAQFHPTLFDDPDDLPPSYEDAIAENEDIAPVADGPRRNLIYSVPDSESPDQQRPAFNYPPDSKTSNSDINSATSSVSGLGRRVSERLFSQNAPRAPGDNRISGSSFSYRRAFSGGGHNTGMLDEEPETHDESNLDRGMSRMRLNTNVAADIGNDSRGVVARSPTNGNGYSNGAVSSHNDLDMYEDGARPPLPTRKPMSSISATPDTTKPVSEAGWPAEKR